MSFEDYLRSHKVGEKFLVYYANWQYNIWIFAGQNVIDGENRTSKVVFMFVSFL